MGVEKMRAGPSGREKRGRARGSAWTAGWRRLRAGSRTLGARRASGSASTAPWKREGCDHVRQERDHERQGLD